MVETGKDGLPILAFPDPRAFEEWIVGQGDGGGREGEQPPGVWLKVAKKGTGVVTVTSAQAVEVALCHGWIDSQLGRYDDVHYLQRYTPRRPGSVWSRVNRDAIARLIAEGRMQPAGLAAVEVAKARGTWERAYEPASTATVPADLQVALDADPEVAAAFAALDKQNRYAIIYRVQDAKRPATRASRIAGFTAMLARGETLYPRPANRRPAAAQRREDVAGSGSESK